MRPRKYMITHSQGAKSGGRNIDIFGIEMIQSKVIKNVLTQRKKIITKPEEIFKLENVMTLKKVHTETIHRKGSRPASKT